MRIAIVDDIESERKELHKRINAQLLHHTLNAQIFEYENGETFLIDAGKERFDLAFLDIYMNGINGVETAAKLRTFDQECILIFTTTSTDHALDGFRVRALHYLVKPYSDDELDNLFCEIIERLPTPEKHLDVRIVGGTARLRFCEIMYAQHFRHQIHIHTSDGNTTVTRQTFRDFTAELEGDERFFLCNRGVIINLEYADDFNGTDFKLKNGDAISVSRDTAKSARLAFCDFLFKRGAKQ